MYDYVLPAIENRHTHIHTHTQRFTARSFVQFDLPRNSQGEIHEGRAVEFSCPAPWLWGTSPFVYFKTWGKGLNLINIGYFDSTLEHFQFSAMVFEVSSLKQEDVADSTSLFSGFCNQAHTHTRTHAHAASNLSFGLCPAEFRSGQLWLVTARCLRFKKCHQYQMSDLMRPE